MAAKVSASTDGGYDFDFVEDISDDFLCVVCHLVLRQPLLIIDCGHKFCEICFAKMKTYSESRAFDLCCPIDRDVIDTTKVFPDKHMERKVKDLKVYCNNKTKDCEWTGDLRSIQDHLMNNCLYEEVSCHNCDVKIERGKLNEHVFSCEKKADGRIERFITEFLGISKEQNEKLSLLEKKMSDQENELKTCHNLIKKQDMELKTCHNRIDQQQETITKLEKVVKEIQPSRNEHLKKLKQLEGAVTKLEDDTKNNASNKSDMRIVNQLNNLDVAIKKQETLMSSFKATMNVLSNEYPVFRWCINNYSEIDKNEVIYSPYFYTSLKGYKVFLMAAWKGPNKGKFGIYLGVKFTQYNDGLMQPFRMAFVIECVRKDGRKQTVHIDEGAWNGESCAGIDFENDIMCGRHILLWPEIKKYLINDCLTIRCWFP